MQNFYLKKKEYGEFIKSKGTKFIKVYYKDEIDKKFKMKFNLKAESYNNYLKSLGLEKKEIDKLYDGFQEGMYIEDYLS